MNCIKCGRECTGTYCESCSFYELNAQCWRCRMYLPTVELQQWRGQLYCPYCIMDIRDGEKGEEEEQGTKSRDSAKQDIFSPDDDAKPFGVRAIERVCDRCKEDLDIVYVFEESKFCEACFHQKKKEWKTGNVQVPPFLKFKVKESPSLLNRVFRFVKRGVKEGLKINRLETAKEKEDNENKKKNGRD